MMTVTGNNKKYKTYSELFCYKAHNYQDYDECREIVLAEEDCICQICKKQGKAIFVETYFCDLIGRLDYTLGYDRHPSYCPKKNEYIDKYGKYWPKRLEKGKLVKADPVSNFPCHKCEYLCVAFYEGHNIEGYVMDHINGNPRDARRFNVRCLCKSCNLKKENTKRQFDKDKEDLDMEIKNKKEGDSMSILEKKSVLEDRLEKIEARCTTFEKDQTELRKKVEMLCNINKKEIKLPYNGKTIIDDSIIKIVNDECASYRKIDIFLETYDKIKDELSKKPEWPSFEVDHIIKKILLDEKEAQSHSLKYKVYAKQAEFIRQPTRKIVEIVAPTKDSNTRLIV